MKICHSDVRCKRLPCDSKGCTFKRNQFIKNKPQVRPPGAVPVPVPVDRWCLPATGPVFLEEGPPGTGTDWGILEKVPPDNGTDWVFVEEDPPGIGPDWVSRPVSCF